MIVRGISINSQGDLEQTALVLKAGGNTGLWGCDRSQKGEATKPMPKTELEGQRKWGSTRPVLETGGLEGQRCAVFLGPAQMLLHLIVWRGRPVTKSPFEETQRLSGYIAGRWRLGWFHLRSLLPKAKVLISRMGWVHPGGDETVIKIWEGNIGTSYYVHILILTTQLHVCII